MLVSIRQTTLLETIRCKGRVFCLYRTSSLIPKSG